MISKYNAGLVLHRTGPVFKKSSTYLGNKHVEVTV